VPNETFWILYSFRSYLGWQLEASGNRLAPWIHLGRFRNVGNDYLGRRFYGEEIPLMGFETIGLLIFARLFELSQFLMDNAALLFFSSLFLILWLTGIITVLRRWAGE
jgi:hypothetical protein